MIWDLLSWWRGVHTVYRVQSRSPEWSQWTHCRSFHWKWEAKWQIRCDLEYFLKAKCPREYRVVKHSVVRGTDYKTVLHQEGVVQYWDLHTTCGF